MLHPNLWLLDQRITGNHSSNNNHNPIKDGTTKPMHYPIMASSSGSRAKGTTSRRDKEQQVQETTLPHGLVVVVPSGHGSSSTGHGDDEDFLLTDNDDNFQKWIATDSTSAFTLEQDRSTNERYNTGTLFEEKLNQIVSEATTTRTTTTTDGVQGEKGSSKEAVDKQQGNGNGNKDLTGIHDYDDKDDSLTSINTDLIRARPRNLRLVFVGDSLTRYQYLSLAYWLRYGNWFDPSIYPNNLVNAHSFHHPLHPNNDWNEFFLQSNRMLQPNELCDCSRQESKHVAVERRYFWDKTRNNTLVYINVSGESTLGHKGLYGRVNPYTVYPPSPIWNTESEQDSINVDHSQEQHQPPSSSSFTFRSGLLADDENDEEWEYANWGDLIRSHVGPLNLGPSAVAILNAGLHPHKFHDSIRTISLKVALEDVGLRGVWKTTTYTREQVVEYKLQEEEEEEKDTTTNDNSQSQLRRSKTTISAMVQRHDATEEMDKTMCHLMDDCFDLTWMTQLNPDYYFDTFHFNEPVYRILNEELLAQLGLLPVHYQLLDRSIVLS